MSYLRFPRQDFNTLCRLCRPVRLNEKFFPAFRIFLLDALGTTAPDLAGRVVELNIQELRLLYDHLREVNGNRSAEPSQAWTPEERTAFTAACDALPSRGRFLRHVRDFLILHFEEALPALARKLARLSRSQFERLYTEAVEARPEGKG